MRKTRLLAGLLALAACGAGSSSIAGEAADRADGEEPRTVHRFTMKTIDGKDAPLSAFAGKALLLVNTASLCGQTPQYASLQKLYEEYAERGLEVLAFPANDFGSQEPGTNAEIEEFCETKYGVTFPLFEKISVKGETIHPLYRYLTEEAGFDGEIGWNFTKFLVDPDGKVVARFGTKTDPLAEELAQALEGVLPAGATPAGK